MLLGLAIGKANVKIKEKKIDKAWKSGNMKKYEKAIDKYDLAAERFEKYLDFEKKVYKGIAGALTVAVLLVPFVTVEGVKLAVKKAKQRKELKPELTIAKACAKIIDKAEHFNFVPLRDENYNRTNMKKDGLNLDSMKTMFGDSIKAYGTLNEKGNVVFVFYEDNKGKHSVFLERDLESGVLTQIADISNDEAREHIKKAWKKAFKKIEKIGQEKNLQSAKLASKTR